MAYKSLPFAMSSSFKCCATLWILYFSWDNWNYIKTVCVCDVLGFHVTPHAPQMSVHLTLYGVVSLVSLSANDLWQIKFALYGRFIYKHTRTKNISISESFVNLAQIPVFGLAYANIYTELYWKIDKWALLCACMYVQYNEMTYDKPNQGNTNRSKKHLRWMYLVVLLSRKKENLKKQPRFIRLKHSVNGNKTPLTSYDEGSFISRAHVLFGMSQIYKKKNNKKKDSEYLSL